MGKMTVIKCSEATGVRDHPLLPSIITTATRNVIFCCMIILTIIGIVHYI